MQEAHFQLTDAEFENQFERGTLDPALFNHEAHLRLAWIHLAKYGEVQAIENINQQLIQFVEIVGAKDKYNRTLTIGAIKAVHHFMKKSKSHTFHDFIKEFPRLKYNFKELIGKHYTTDIFNSAKAIKEFIEPERLPFD
jgi:hypothetical protein